MLHDKVLTGSCEIEDSNRGHSYFAASSTQPSIHLGSVTE